MDMLNRPLGALLGSLALIFSTYSPATADEGQKLQDSIGYKLAVIHAQASDPESALLGQAAPSREAITHFLTLMEVLRNRCVNPENEIADGIVGTWKLLQKHGYNLPLPQLAEELTNFARNRVLFGDERVDFKQVTAVWLSQSPIGDKLK
jgi:hypothetical protein